MIFNSGALNMRSELSFQVRLVWHPIAWAAMAAMTASGCASMAAHTAATYERGAASEEKFSADADSCAKQAEAHTKQYGMGPYDVTHGSYNFMFDSCMQAGGYARKKPAP
jgi:hypothetical protein